MTDLRAHLQTTLGDAYTIERELGGGGMSRVFVAREQSLGRSVVLKVLPSDTAGAISVERFKREIHLAASLQQANIVPLLTAGIAGGVAYYTMPFVKGESLRARLAAKGALPVAECVAILRDVARALAFAHDEGIVHRDIKPENILLSGGAAVVTDFGIARAVAESATQAEATTLTQLGVALGTPAYMAPEQALGEQVDRRADIYALGVLAYEMLTGAVPFAGRSAQAMLAAHVMEVPASVTTECPDVPRSLATLIARCLAKEQRERPESAASVLAALDMITPVREAAKESRVKPTVAVLPLVSMSASADDEYFADGITEDVIAELSRIASLNVIARTSVMRYKKTEKRPRDIGADLGASHVVEGRVRRAGQRLRIVAKLVDARSESTLWTETFDRDVADVFAIQSEVAHSVTTALAAKLTPAEQSRASIRQPRANPEAYDAYLRGRFEWNKGTTDSYARSVEYFERAIALDPHHGMSHAALATVLIYSSVLKADPRTVAERARAHALRALELDGGLPDACAALGYIHFWFDWNWSEAERRLAEAVELGPSSALAHQHQAAFLANSGRADEAAAAARRAVELDPFMPLTHHELGFALHQAERFAEAIAAHDRALELSPDLAVSLLVKGFSLIELGDFDAALSLARHCKATSPMFSLADAEIVLALLGTGRAGEARQALANLEAEANAQPSALAWAQAALGEIEAAFRSIERMIAQREAFTVSLPTFRWWDPLRSDPRFPQVLKRLRFPDRLQVISERRGTAYFDRVG